MHHIQPHVYYYTNTQRLNWQGFDVDFFVELRGGVDRAAVIALQSLLRRHSSIGYVAPAEFERMTALAAS